MRGATLPWTLLEVSREASLTKAAGILKQAKVCAINPKLRLTGVISSLKKARVSSEVNPS
jgi:hypothetical protein